MWQPQVEHSSTGHSNRFESGEAIVGPAITILTNLIKGCDKQVVPSASQALCVLQRNLDPTYINVCSTQILEEEEHIHHLFCLCCLARFSPSKLFNHGFP